MISNVMMISDHMINIINIGNSNNTSLAIIMMIISIIINVSSTINIINSTLPGVPNVLCSSDGAYVLRWLARVLPRDVGLFS